MTIKVVPVDYSKETDIDTFNRYLRISGRSEDEVNSSVLKIEESYKEDNFSFDKTISLIEKRVSNYRNAMGVVTSCNSESPETNGVQFCDDIGIARRLIARNCVPYMKILLKNRSEDGEVKE